MLQALGQESAAEAEARRALALDPGWHIPYFLLGTSAYIARRFGQAASRFDTVLALEPGYSTGYHWRARVRLMLGDARSARADADAVLRLSPSASAVLTLALVDAMTGQRERAMAVVDSLLALDQGRFRAGWVLVALGEHERALDLLERPKEIVSSSFKNRWRSLREPEFHALREHPRLQRLFREVRPRAPAR